ncbi:probable serine/threonine-protein kinase SIS8 at C-terminar half [Coccomyxa sp. Obi]|nr:probable serine/threonine-protein kinase SIS8 at C-terminar half [Coccomyxa sp. Obi]
MTEGEALAPSPAPDQAAYLLVVMEVHGVDIQPFGYQDRLDFLVSMDEAIDDITLDNIELLAVEEFLPASGPSAESLMNLFGTNAVFKSPKAASGNAPPPVGALAAIKLAGQPASPLASVTRTSGRRRQLLQSSTGQLAPPPVLTEPVVRVTLRISTTVTLMDKVEQELQRSMQNTTTGLAARFRAKGHDVSGIYIVSMTSSLAPIGGPSIAPAGAVTMPPPPPLGGPQTAIVRSNKSGTGSINSTDNQAERNTNGTTIGVSIGVGVPVLLGAAGVAIYLLVFRRQEDLQKGVKAAKSRHWGGDTPDPWGFLMNPQANQFRNPLYPLPKEPPGDVPKRGENGLEHSNNSQLLQAYIAAANGSKGRDGSANEDTALSREGSSSGDAAAERDGGGSASVSGKHKGEWGEGPELVAYSDLKFSRVIGEGSFGRVFLGKWRETTVAIKLLSQPLVPPRTGNNWDFGEGSDSFTSGDCNRHKRNAKAASLLEELRKEARLMAVLRHPNIVMFLGACSSPPCMVTEFCARGSLLDILSRARENPAAAAELGWNRRLNMALEAAKGMLYLHSRAEPVLHRDLKSANLLVDKHWRVKVADFNLSRVMNASAVVSSVSATNPRWMAPEVLAGKSYDCAADVFSFGIILWELLTWHIPWEDLGPWQVVILVVDQGQRPELPADPAQLPGKPLRHISTYLDLMCHCWHQDPAQRPTFDRVISHLRVLIEAEGQAAAAPLHLAASTQLPAAPEPQAAAEAASADSAPASQGLPGSTSPFESRAQHSAV